MPWHLQERNTDAIRNEIYALKRQLAMNTAELHWLHAEFARMRVAVRLQEPAAAQSSESKDADTL